MVSTRSSTTTATVEAALAPMANGLANGHINARRPISPRGWAHTPSSLTLAWMAISLPLVAWDTGYVLLRPLSMPGGRLHAPLWSPYALYGEVDHMYGLKQYEAGNGFTSAQGALNLIETLLYGLYLYLWYANARPLAGSARAAVAGRAGGAAVLIGFAAAVMTVSKTVLYWLNEYFSAFDNIGHNTAMRLVILWIIPNGLWLIFPTLMIYSMGDEIVSGLAQNSAQSEKEE